MSVYVIAAMSENRVIGRGGGLPWHLPDDMKHFQQLTTGHTVIMGRKTFESMDGPLPDRRNIVITRQSDYAPSGAEVAHSLDEALRLAGDGDCFVSGGEEIYQLALPVADRLYLTVVHAEVDGDVRFPQFDTESWRMASESHRPADDRHAHAFTFQLYERARRAE